MFISGLKKPSMKDPSWGFGSAPDEEDVITGRPLGRRIDRTRLPHHLTTFCLSHPHPVCQDAIQGAGPAPAARWGGGLPCAAGRCSPPSASSSCLSQYTLRSQSACPILLATLCQFCLAQIQTCNANVGSKYGASSAYDNQTSLGMEHPRQVDRVNTLG